MPRVFAEFDGVPELMPPRPEAHPADANLRPPRRRSTITRYQTQLPETQGLAFEFRPLISARTHWLLPATPLACIALMVFVGAPYAANERMADASPTLRTALRGLIVGIWMYATSLIEFMATHVCMPHAACSCCMVGTS
jgi:hypothetical protein